MRYKYFETTVKDYEDTIMLNWITQEPFNTADFEVFIKEVKSAFNQIIEDINYKILREIYFIIIFNELITYRTFCSLHCAIRTKNYM